MAILLLAEHDNATVSEQTAKALTAAVAERLPSLAGQVLGGRPEHLDALLDGEETLLGVVLRHGDDDVRVPSPPSLQW
mgnify:CR=1 FL=1